VDLSASLSSIEWAMAVDAHRWCNIQNQHYQRTKKVRNRFFAQSWCFLMLRRKVSKSLQNVRFSAKERSISSLGRPNTRRKLWHGICYYLASSFGQPVSRNTHAWIAVVDQ
jgi:phosphopantetheinyl transferase (holo-ACP synthase)